MGKLVFQKSESMRPAKSPQRYHWAIREEYRSLPRICQLWLWWCTYGPKRSGQGTVGGNFLFRMMQSFLKTFPAGNDNLLPIYSKVNDSFIVVDLLDFEVFQHTIRLFCGGNAETEVQSMFLRDGDAFIDVGANHGAFSLLGATLVGENGLVYSIEPQPRLVEALRKSCKLNCMKNGNRSHPENWYSRRGTFLRNVRTWTLRRK
jgi:hypothetical protein